VKHPSALTPTEFRARLAERPRSAPFLPATRPGCALALDERLLRATRDGLPFDVPRCGIMFREQPGEDPWTGAPIPSSIINGLAVLDLRGPIEHHTGWYWDNYEDLGVAVDASLACESVKATVLRIDSPGGVAAGMHEAHKAIRRAQARTGKPVLCYVDEMACSAAYCIASSCSEVWGPPSMHVGSVGVILCTVDETAALDKAGLAIRYVVSGKRKADLHPGQPVTDDVLRVAQAKVDVLAAQFFHLVAKARRRNTDALASSSAVEALQAGVFVGQDAVRIGLADGVASWPKFLDLVRKSISARGMTDQSVSGAKGAAARRTR